MLKNRVALITGGAQGIGAAIAVECLMNGMKVVVADVDQEALRQFSHLISIPKSSAIHNFIASKKSQESNSNNNKTGIFDKDDLITVKVDVSSEDDVKNMIQVTSDAFGGRLDLLVNNAALANPYQGKLEELSLERWNQTINVNLTGTFLCCKHAIPLLRQTHSTGGLTTGESAAIVNIASTRALMSEPNTEAYSTTKGGIVAFTHALANSVGPQIRVNSISPGWIHVSDWRKRELNERGEPIEDEAAAYGALRKEDHHQHPVGRVGRPEDIARMVMFLANPEQSGFVTGQNFVCDGGMTKKMIYEE